MTIKEYQEQAYTAIPDHDSKHDEIMHWLIGLGEEVGELMSEVKHHYYGGEKLDGERVGKEIGDILWYLAAAATVLNIDLQSAAELNIHKLRSRFPDGEFDNKRSQARGEIEAAELTDDVYKSLVTRMVSDMNMRGSSI